MGLENPAGLKQITHATTYRVTAGRDWRDCNWGPGDAFFCNAYADPWPVSPEVSIVSFGDNGFNRHGLYILCHNGLILPLYMHDTQSCFSAVTLNKRSKPLAIAGEAPVESGTGTFFVQDIYQGLTQQGVTNGTVKELRIIRPTPKKWNTEGPRFHDHYPVAGYGSYYIKENLGTVPVHEDGTAYFTVPSNCELYFIALDENGKEIQRMGSVTQITTDEHVSCIGCHEDRMKAPVVDPNAFKRLSRPPDRLTPPQEGAGPFDYVKHVQPVLDRYCIKCHSGRNPKARLDLTGDKTRFFNMSYDQLIERGQVEYYFINPGPTGVFPAMQTGSMLSKLTKLIENNHGKINMDNQSRRAIYAWIDSNVQYYNTWDMSRPHTTGGRDTWLGPWIETFSATYDKNCLSCHGLLYNKQGGSGMNPKHHWINLTNPEHSRILNAHLSPDAGGMGLAGQKNNTNSPAFKDTGDPIYQEMLKSIEQGQDALLAKPRMDMPGALAIPQERNFGRVF